MSIFAGKVLSRLLLPLPVALALVALALLLLARGLRRTAAAALVLAIAELWLLATPVVMRQLVGSLEAMYAPTPLAALAPADAILLLGGATKPATPPRDFPDLSEAGDRVVLAARLFRAGKAPLVVASGGPLAWDPDGPAEAPALAELLVLLGVPDAAIVQERSSGNTHENCLASKRLLDARGAREVLLVTSALHMRRALATCRSAGLAVRPAPTDFLVSPAAQPTTALDFLPDAQALMLDHAALLERMGYEVYRMRGWIRD